MKPSCYFSEFLFKALENRLFHGQTSWQLVLCLVPWVLCPTLPPRPALVPKGPQCHQGPQAGGAFASLHFPACSLAFLKPEQMQHPESITAVPNLEQCWQMGSKPVRSVMEERQARQGNIPEDLPLCQCGQPLFPFICRAQHSHFQAQTSL